jgi:Transcriptional regulators
MAFVRPTQSDVARLAGVSRQTVSLVINNDPRVSDVKRVAVNNAMHELGYRANAAARQLASNRSNTIGIICADLLNPFVAVQLEMLRRSAQENGFMVAAFPVDENAEAERNALDRMIESGVAGIVMLSPMASRETLAKYGSLVPIVVISRDLLVEGVCFIKPDDELGSALATKHIIDQGYDNVYFVGPLRDCEGDSTECRFVGYSKTMQEAGKPSRRIVTGEHNMDLVKNVLIENGQGTAFVCHNDKIALGVASVTVDQGLMPGEHVGISGYDNSYLSQYSGLPLTTVDMHIQVLVNHVLETLNKMLAGDAFEAEVVVAPKLVIRKSTDRN